MDQAAVDDAEQMVRDELTKRFPEAPVEKVALVRYGDDPVVGPGEIILRITLTAPDDKAQRRDFLREFHRAHLEEIDKFRHDLMARLPEIRAMEFHTTGTVLGLAVAGGDWPVEARAPGGAELTPVMARLAAADLETLDTLITAGIAPNRAEAVRWSLARIRERPAYAQLRDKTREIEELKAQF
jgi:hypothetical protein